MACPSWCVHVGQFCGECSQLVGHRNCGTLTIKPGRLILVSTTSCLRVWGVESRVEGGQA
jgi:hypothetical protein